MSIKTVLSNNNPHERDKGINFYERWHKYEVIKDKYQKYTSVTTWVHSYFPKFDADAIIKSMMNGKGWKEGHKYWGLSPDEIKASWNTTRDSSAGAGTNLHENIEKFMNNNNLKCGYTQKDLYDAYDKTNENENVEWDYFIKFIQDHLHLKPYRTEWIIYHEDVKIAGSVDMVYENPDGTLEIYDWKRCKEITTINNWNQTATNALISHMPASNFWQYALQLNTYKKIIEDKYGKKVTKLCLVRLHPDNPDETYELINVPDLSEDISNLFEERKNTL
jgi:hypothetical protein